MARNAHPEVTRRRILDAAQKLFATKGYDNTSIQDILDELGNLSKGAIYHHFKSKLDILDAIGDEDNRKYHAQYEALLERKDLNGLQKIRELFLETMTDTAHVERLKGLLPTTDDPQNLAEDISMWTRTLPDGLRKLIDYGIKDGSIITDYPQEAAELLTLLMNIWFMPNFYPGTHSELQHRAQCLATICVSIGVPAITHDMIDQLADFYSQIQIRDSDDAINNGGGRTEKAENRKTSNSIY